MSWTLRWSGAAKADLLEIWLYIAPENVNAADRQIAKIEQAVFRLGDFPRSAPARHDIGPEVRAITVGNYLVLYRVIDAERQVDLMRVIDGRRDLAALFAMGEL